MSNRTPRTLRKARNARFCWNDASKHKPVKNMPVMLEGIWDDRPFSFGKWNGENWCDEFGWSMVNPPTHWCYIKKSNGYVHEDPNYPVEVTEIW